MMTKLEDIEKAVSGLPPKEMEKFRKWFDEFDARLWDEQIEHDATTGKLDKLAERAVEDHRAGRSKEL